MESSPETTTRLALESPISGLIENSNTHSLNANKLGTSKESNLEVPSPTPSAATEGTSSVAGIGNDRTIGSRNPTIRVVPFQSMPQSTQEELGKELFDDPLLSIDNVKKLADYMQWSFKYTKVNLLMLLLAYVELLVVYDQSCFVFCRKLPIDPS